MKQVFVEGKLRKSDIFCAFFSWTEWYSVCCKVA